MATYSRRTITSTRHEWVVPAAEPWGAASAEVGKAWTAAQNAHRAAYQVPVGTALPDNVLRFHTEDDAIVIRFTTEEPTA